MKISFLIVTKNRPEDLVFTLMRLKALIDLSIHEVLVFIDGCSKTEPLVTQYNWVKWTVAKPSVSASPARAVLYKKAKGDIFIGLDDDSHPISLNFIQEVETVFRKNSNIGIIAFQEVRGLFLSDAEALKQSKYRVAHFTKDFVGCGFAIKRKVYQETNGFPLWIDIYGEEPALALEVLDLGYQIFYQPDIKVNHRIDIEKRKLQGRNYFRFEHQLQNAIRFYLVYYPTPVFKIIKLLFHNFKKYALSDVHYFKLFFKVCFSTLVNLPGVLKYRKPVKPETIKLDLKQLNYSA
ncbi:glycosyltransferase family 2 protein [Algibacter pacificus]|uniref:glycosyltransferase family 2 protein n=1 Tax=Algibacter pacificus TaxID=2599389 RepID=UPI0011CB2513|nr:glycosyltransferase family 2 protein [Algibacter pacificus]